jgi:3-oxoacyl-[acyl-carrier-protein] synthase-1
MSHPVHIVATSARTPVGLTATGTAAAIHAGISRLREHPFMVDPMGEPLRCAYDAVLDPWTLAPDRLVAMARHAMHDLDAQLPAIGRRRERIPMWLALPEPRPGFGPNEATRVHSALAAERLPNIGRVEVREGGRGHAGALLALGIATERVRAGECDLAIVGGVDSYLDADTLDWLDAAGRLSHSGRRGGFSPGEGCGMLAIARGAACASLGLRSLGLVRDVACEQESRSADSPEGLLGEALGKAVARACMPVARARAVLHDIYCDINGERERVDDWSFALLRGDAPFRDGTSYVMSAHQCGDLGAATPGVNVALATHAWRRRNASGPTALVWGASWAGLRGAAFLEASTG